MNNTDNRVICTIENGIARVKLNRIDKLNAIDMQMFEELDSTARQLKKNKAVRVVIVSGNGIDFCSGIDVQNVLSNPKNAIKLLWKWWPWQANLAQRVSVNWRKLNAPVIMSIQGRCWGGGLQIALGGDFRIAHPQSSLAIMENKWGLIPDMGGTLALREIMSKDHAMELAMTAKAIDAEQAQKIGLVTHVHPEPERRANELADELLNRNPDTIAHIKRFYQQAWHKNDGGLLASETRRQIQIISGKNQKIAVHRETKDPNKPWRI